MRLGRPKKSNSYKIDGDVALIDVSTPKHPTAVAIIDLSDLASVLDGKGRWSANQPKAKPATLYVARNEGRSRKKLHRHILALPPGVGIVDHRDGDALNNRRNNLRQSTNAENCANGRTRAGTSQFKGVHRRGDSWRAAIRNQRLGSFATEAAAARAYDVAAKRIFGEFARLNFPEGDHV